MTINKIDFPCSCSFPVENGLVKFNPNFDQLNYQCQNTWDLFARGETKGVFQLETFLGQRFAEKVKPRNINELSDLVSLLRPGCLQAFMEDGKNVVEHYIMRKFGQEESSPLHDSLRGLLDDTYFILVYQEQAMSIASKLAGFTPSETDEKIRKVLGKKQSDKINEVKEYFLKGCEKIGIVNKEDAERIFSWVAAGQRYSFNKSHGVSYAITSYLSAYIKQHFPLPYFKHNLRHSKFKNKDKQLEMRQIILDAKKHGIEVLPHDLRDNNYEFEIFDKKIKFGLINIKNVGELTYIYISENIEDIRKCNWLQFLIKHATKLNSRHIISIIHSGCIDYMGINRKRMKFEYDIISDFSDSQLEKIRQLDLTQFRTLNELLIYLSGLDTGKDKILSSKTQKAKVISMLELLNNPPESLDCTMLQIEKWETDLLNFPLSCTRLDGNINASMATMKCSDFYNSKQTGDVSVAGILEEIKIIKTKNGDDMCFLSLIDETGELSDIVGFKEFVENNRDKLVKDNSVILKGYRSFKKMNSLVAQELIEI